ncbi:MAG TPA: hypothetical protein PLD84_07775 [Chitinophagales bacterium]|nr:hypothetical protein [Chitinophagales bacterium]
MSNLTSKPSSGNKSTNGSKFKLKLSDRAIEILALAGAAVLVFAMMYFVTVLF